MSDPVSSSDSSNNSDLLEISETVEVNSSVPGQVLNDLANENTPQELTETLTSELQDSTNVNISMEDEQSNTEVANTETTTTRRQRPRNARGTRTVRRRQSSTELRNLEFEMSLPSTEVLRSMSLRGIYYDRRNHGWQVRIRKRQAEVSRYFSAKRYGVEKSYEMALRFYQVNIVGSNLFGDLPSVTIPKLPDPEDDHRCSVCIAEEPNLDIIDLSIGALNLHEKISNLINVSNATRGGSSQHLDGSTIIDVTKFLNSRNDIPNQTSLNPVISHIPNGYANNTVPNQFVQNNLFINYLYNMGSAVGFQNSGIPMQNFVRVPNAALFYGQNPVASLNIPFTSNFNPNFVPIYVNDTQTSANDTIVKALYDAESIWRGLSFDNRNNCWYLRTENNTLKIFDVEKYGPIDSLVLAFQNKYSTLDLSPYQYYIKIIIGNNITILQKFMSIYGFSKTSDKSTQDSEQTTSTHFKDMSVNERLNYFNTDELMVFINTSLQLGYMVNSLLLHRSTQILLSGYNGTYFQQLAYLPTVLNVSQPSNNGLNMFSCPTNQVGIPMSQYLLGYPFFQGNYSMPDGQSSNRK
ncbi:hypothetical protein FG379_002049 [Cryptosporidium bovis]|uniref:uncharacterized protein n=1 Tax=Cryptosporidium bovis TaxID=310047 RepID=UPI00351A5B2C|nr:hypothetical protein FG379_002049 [Cryptosporidium bovis]